MKPSLFIAILIGAISLIGYSYLTQSSHNAHRSQTTVTLATPVAATEASLVTSAMPVLQDSQHRSDTSHRVATGATMVTPASATTGPADTNLTESAMDSMNTDMPVSELYDPTDGMSDEEKTVYHIMDTSALAMFIRHDPKHASLDMMSRCPSGYQCELTDTIATNNIRVGVVELYTGCDGHKVCLFRVNLLTGVVWLKDRHSRAYLTVSEYERKRWGKAS